MMIERVLLGLDEGDLVVQVDAEPATTRYEVELLDNLGNVLAIAVSDGAEVLHLYGNPPPGIYSARVRAVGDAGWVHTRQLHLTLEEKP